MPDPHKTKIVVQAAKHYGIPAWFLYGLWGTESSFGANARTSSAGAVGDFQFLPSTARSIGVNPYNFRSAAYGAAKYLAQAKGRGLLGMVAHYYGAPSSTYLNSVRRFGRQLPKGIASSAAAGGGGGAVVLPGKAGTLVRGLPSPGDASLLSAQLAQATRPMVPVTPPSLPSFAAHTVMPAGYQAPASQSLQAPPASPDVLQMALAAGAQGGVPHTTMLPGSSPTVISSGARGVSGAGAHAKSPDAPNSVGRMLAIAEAWDRARVPYLWGGGHGSRPARPGQRVDCSGYVSAILGVSPRVSGAFGSYGQRGHGRIVTIYSNSGHVLINIGHRWFATSHSNPGGGAGEISRPSSGYLSSFRTSHPRGL